MKAALVCAAFSFLALGCANSPDRFGGSRQSVAEWAALRGLAVHQIVAGRFHLLLAERDKSAHATAVLTVYIEGDGAAWPTPYHPPRDPTPTRPVSLVLAAADPSAAVVYLGRPCQYLSEEALQACDSVYWTERRFAPEVVAAYDDAIDQLKSRFGVRQLRLIGYSGGGVLAALLAARRDDVDVLITVAAPLAINKWTAVHKVSPLKGSLDPAELGENMRLRQSVHFVGGRDEIVPAAVVEHFIRRKGGRMEIIPEFDHECCWARDWVALLGRVTIREKAK